MPEIVKRDVHSVARFLKIPPNRVYSKLKWMQACAVAESISYPIQLNEFAALCRVRNSTLIKWGKNHPGLYLHERASLSKDVVSSLLDQFKRAIWIHNVDKEIPLEFLPFVDELITQRKQEIGQSHIERTNHVNELRNALLEKYQNCTLDELGALFNRGDNELDELESNVIKSIINEKLARSSAG